MALFHIFPIGVLAHNTFAGADSGSLNLNIFRKRGQPGEFADNGIKKDIETRPGPLSHRDKEFDIEEIIGPCPGTVKQKEEECHGVALQHPPDY